MGLVAHAEPAEMLRRDLKWLKRFTTTTGNGPWTPQKAEQGARMQPTRVGQPLPSQIEAMVVRDMEDLGVDPALVYAFQHTGMLVTDATIDGYSDAQLVSWQEAVDRYRRLSHEVA